MIKIILGNVGSGKTAFAVRHMALNLNNRKTYSNIKTNLDHQIDISPEMIIKKEIVDYKKNKKSGDKEPVYKFQLNTEFWRGINEPINVILDEAHTILNSRRAMSKVNIVVSDWLALIRRVLGSTDSGFGELWLISQLWNRIDIIARDMATNVIFLICHYLKSCDNCGVTWSENSEMPEGYIICPSCSSSSIFKHTHKLECWHFPNMQLFQMWHQFGQRTFYKRYYINDIEDYFKNFNTLAWDNMFATMY